MGAVPADARFPLGNGFIVAEAVVVEAAQVVAGIGIGGVGTDGEVQNGDIFQRVGEAIAEGGIFSLFNVASSIGMHLSLLSEKAEAALWRDW